MGIIAVSTFMIIFIAYSATKGYASRFDTVGLMLCSVALMVMGSIVFLMVVKTMPLRIYEAGFTLYWAGIKDGWRRRETLIPKDKIMSVDIVEGKYGLHYISVRYDDGTITAAMRHIEFYDGSIAMARLEALHRIAGHKFTNRARAAMG